jgi:hypothetical protein
MIIQFCVETYKRLTGGGGNRKMVSYVVYRASIESKGRSVIPTRLKALGCQQLQKAFWKLEEKRVHQVLSILRNNKPILLKRLREIKAPELAKKKGFANLGSLIIVSFMLPKGANREKVTNFLRKAPCIRLRRSVYAFSQIHTFHFKEPKLVDARKFVNFLKEIRGKVKIISRVVVVNKISVEMLLHETKDRVEKRFVDIVTSCKELYLKSQTGKDFEILRDRFSRIKRKFLILKKVANVYNAWLKIDFSKKMMKAYHSLRKVNSLFDSK